MAGASCATSSDFCVISHSGPAGHTAALYAARTQLEPLLFGSSIFVGGSLTATTEVENFPGFPDGVDGPVLMENMRVQAETFGAEMVDDDDIVFVHLPGEIKEFTDSESVVHRAKAVIIATGSGYRELGLSNEEKLSGRDVSWCATCEGLFLRDSDTAMEEATVLLRFARSVTVVHRRSTLRASQFMRSPAFAIDEISFAFDSEIVEIKEENGMLGAVALCNTPTGRSVNRRRPASSWPSDTTPAPRLFAGRLYLDDEGYITAESPSTVRTSPGSCRWRRGRPHLPPGRQGHRNRRLNSPRHQALPRRTVHAGFRSESESLLAA